MASTYSAKAYDVTISRYVRARLRIASLSQVRPYIHSINADDFFAGQLTAPRECAHEIPIDAGCEMQHHTRMPKLALEQTSPPVEDDSLDLLLRISRRGFAGSAAAVAAAAFSPATRLLDARRYSQQPAPRNKPKGEAKFDLTAEQVQHADAKLANAIREFGSRLSAEQRQRLRRILLYNEKMLASVRAFSLENGDPPASVLKY